MNKKEFEEKLRDKKIDECVSILRKEIIEILTKKIQEKDRYFKYSTTEDLAQKSKQCLESKYFKIANALYGFDIMDELSEYKLDEMFEMYKILC